MVAARPQTEQRPGGPHSLSPALLSWFQTLALSSPGVLPLLPRDSRADSVPCCVQASDRPGTGTGLTYHGSKCKFPWPLANCPALSLPSSVFLSSLIKNPAERADLKMLMVSDPGGTGSPRGEGRPQPSSQLCCPGPHVMLESPSSPGSISGKGLEQPWHPWLLEAWSGPAVPVVGGLLGVVGPHRPGRSGLASLPVSPCCLMSLRAKVGVKTPLPLTGWGQGCRATDMWPGSLAHSTPSAASSRPPHPCHACGSPPFPRLHNRRPCQSRVPVLRLARAGSRTQASVQCQNAAFPVREPWPPCLLQRASTSRTLQGTVLLPRGTSRAPLGWLVPILGLCFGASSSPASSVSFGDSQRLLVAGATESTTWEGSACPRSSRVFVVSVVQSVPVTC